MYNGNVKFVRKERWKLAKNAFKNKQYSLAKAYFKGIYKGLYSKL
jgi:hypothetical protein